MEQNYNISFYRFYLFNGARYWSTEVNQRLFYFETASNDLRKFDSSPKLLHSYKRRLIKSFHVALVYHQSSISSDILATLHDFNWIRCNVSMFIPISKPVVKERQSKTSIVDWDIFSGRINLAFQPPRLNFSRHYDSTVGYAISASLSPANAQRAK